MTNPIRVVKKEIRILGLDFCHENWIPGAVLRGGQTLDGIITITTRRHDTLDVGRKIRRSRYYPELRAIMMHDPEERCRPETLQKITRLPVIKVSARKPKGQAYKLQGRSRRHLWLKTSLPSETLRAIIFLTWTYGSLPEPARVAHLLGQVQNRLPPEG